MDIFDAIILGIIQGLTEFLPVSSSGHLELAKEILGGNSVPEESMLFTVVLHAATALSTIVVFRKDILYILQQLFKFEANEETAFVFKILVSMFPAAFVGVFFNDYIELLFGGQVMLVGSMLVVTSALLLLADKSQVTQKKVSFFSAVVIGVSQAIAILPGISRSGATISTSVLLGIDRERAARFSFLMVVPLIMGKMAKDILDGALTAETNATLPMVVGFVAAFFAGLIACKWMISLVKNSKLSYFAAYCFAVGAGSIIYAMIIE
ncbi:undecaprenyl-diphosphate phosphatase [Limibacter armeniacum]|uniref:undecaprenyl-diphosphate phosphatase n=1 Tax=Limibacter armeniacum TaxID=466084 RepID=UPI002FE6AD15